MVSFNRQPHARTKPLTCGPNRCGGLHPPTNRGEPYDPENHESVTCAAVEAGMSRMVHVKGSSVDPCCPDTGVEAGSTVLTNLVHEDTGQPIYSTTLYDDDGNIITQTLFYYDPTTGDQIVTTSGFTAVPANVETHSEDVYDTLSSGVVERITKFVTTTDGSPTSVDYTEYGNTNVYTPSGIVAPKPQKVQMGQEDLTVGGGSPVTFQSTPTAANSQGQTFPQHAFVHVHVDSQDNSFGIAYTTDGTNPSEAHEFERSEGQPISLDTFQEIKGFVAVPLDRNGDIDLSGSIEITVEYNNIDVDKDDI